MYTRTYINIGRLHKTGVSLSQLISSTNREGVQLAPPLARELLAVDGSWGRDRVVFWGVSPGRLAKLQWMAQYP